MARGRKWRKVGREQGGSLMIVIGIGIGLAEVWVRARYDVGCAGLVGDVDTQTNRADQTRAKWRM